MKFTLSAALSATICAAGFAAVPAYAKERSEIREDIECMPAKDIVKLLSKFDKLDPEQRDSVDAVVTAKFDVDEGQSLPGRMFMRSEGVDKSLTIEPDGLVSDFSRIGGLPKDGEICVEDQARAGMNREEDGLSFDVDIGVKYKNTSGRYSLAELRDGAKDGKSFYKKLVPAPIRLLIPKMTHISLNYDNPNAEENKVRVFAGNTEIEGLIVEPFEKTLVVEIEHIEALGADTLVISGGEYELEPTPSIEKMKKMGLTNENKGNDKPK